MRPYQQKLAFIAAFLADYQAQHGRERCVQAAGELLRLAKRRHTLALRQCQGCPGIERIPYPRAGVLIEEWEEKIGRRLERLLARVHAVTWLFKLGYESQGDPRSWVLRVRFQSGWQAVPT